MVIEMRSWARIGSPTATPSVTAPMSVLQSSINSLHLANQQRKQELKQIAVGAIEPNTIEPLDPETQDVPGVTDTDEEVDSGDVDDQAAAEDPLNR